VIFVGDGIVRATGLSRAGFGEEVEFENKARGLILNLDEDTTSIILFSTFSGINEGSTVKTTGKVLNVNASEDLIGRVIDPLGAPLDGKSLKVTKGKEYNLEKIAAGVVERQGVDTPIKTGIKSIDAMTPIGRGQRQLIIGDRNTGKTAIAVDTILNQKKKDLGLKQVICIYCAIGQKRGNIARTVSILEQAGSMDYTIVVASSASDPAAFQFLAPFTATAIAEYFMDKGQDVLIVYDDLSKHANSYRQISLILRRPAGREAYPGDIFYLHSRILERSVRMSNKLGGGSITSLPIIETQADDISAYIPTNVISITDGQIYLKADLFNAGTRPAVDVGLSVSRVGGAAQTKGMKQVAGPLRLELAQYRSLAAFAQFGSDLDAETLKQIERGKRVSEILNQPQFTPLDEVSEIISIYSATSGALDDFPVEKVKAFETKVSSFVKARAKKAVAALQKGEKLDEKLQKELKDAIVEFKKSMM
ncbi:MAG: F0F1 ATP synthase subunit alpha, partial [Candidatus Levyibacteriota bacterium]